MLPLRPFQPEPDGDPKPIERIVGTLIRYAIKDGACEIHLQPKARNQGFTAFYRLQEGEELVEQMDLPPYVWRPLRTHLEKLAGDERAFQVDLTSAKHHISIAYTLKFSVRDALYGETLVLTISAPH